MYIEQYGIIDIIISFRKTYVQQNNMQQQKQQAQPQKVTLKPKNPFILKFSTQQKPRRILSLNRLNYPQNLAQDGTIIAKKDIIEHQLFDHHIVQTNMKIQGELKRLQVAFIHEKVPEFYAYYFMNRLITASEDKIEDKIVKQLQQIKAKRSFFHVIVNSIKARQGCLKQLQRCLDNLFNNQDDNVTKYVFRQQITHYRKLTGFVISHIRSWKSYLNDISPQIDFTAFLYHGQDYLLKLLNDCQFIFNSFLTRHLKFSYRNDPYIMRPYIEEKQSKFIDLFKFQQQQKNIFMVDMNFLAAQRAKYLQTKMNSKNQKIKQIQRIYHYRDIPLTSRIFVKKVPTPNSERKQPKQPNQQIKEVFVDNFMERKGVQSEKKFKLAQLSKKSDKIKKIKEIFGKTSQSTTRMINSDMFQTIGGSSQNSKFVSPYEQKLRYTQFNTKKIKIQNMNYQSDFQNLVRKKQLQVLQGDSSEASKTHRSFKNIKIKDNLSQSRKFFTKQQGLSQLQKILNQLDTFSPQKLQNFKLKKKQDPKSQTLIKLNEGKVSKSRLFEPSKTLLQHNQQVYVNVRNQVIQQIQNDLKQRQANQQKKKQENQKIQEILQKKLNQESLRIINDSRVKQLQGRQHLAKQLQSSSVFGYQQPMVKNSQKLSYLQQQLKKQMQLKWLREVQEQLKRKTDLAEMQKLQRKKQMQLNKKLQKVKQKQQTQRRFQQIQKQQRAKALKKQIQLDQQRKRQIQQQMKIVIQRQRESMEKFAASQKNQVQEQLRQAMKVQMLESLKKQNQKYYDNEKKQEQIKKKQKDYRQQVRAKVQQQYNLAQQMKQNRQKQQKVAKIRLVKQKLGQFDTFASKKQTKKQGKIQAIANQSLAQQKSALFNQQEVKSRITQFPDFRQSIFPKYQKNAQSQKKKLRQQFQLQLFAFRKPETYQQNKPQQIKTVYQQGKFPIKDFRNIIDQQMKQKQKQREQKEKQAQNQGVQKQILEIDQTKQNNEQNIQQIKLVQKNQKISNEKDENKQMRKTLKSEANSDRFTKFSNNNQQQRQKQIQRQRNEQDQLARMKLGMTYQQYQVYKKKKNAISAKRDIQGQNSRKKAILQKNTIVKVIQKFQKMDDLQSQKNMNEQKLQDFSQIPDNLSFKKENQSIIKKKQNKLNMKQIQEQDLQDLNQNVKKDVGKHRKNIDDQNNQFQLQQNKKQKRKSPTKVKKQKDEDNMTVNSRVTSFMQKHFVTSDQDDQKIQKKAKKVRRVSKKKKQVQQIQQKSQNQQQKQTKNKNYKNKQKSIKQQVIPKKIVTLVKIRQIPVASLSQFFTDHFDHLPKVIKKINIYKKQQLIKFLLEHSSFTILQYIKQSVSIGLGIVLFNQNKSKYRSLNIIHLGSYDQNDYLDILINIVRYCFKNDPCQQIAMSTIYDRDVTDQWQFTKNFEKKFDPYGAIFQKKIFNTQFERKYVLRRNIGQNCKVQTIPQFNRGIIKLMINSLMVQADSQNQVNQLIQSDQYQQIGFNVGYYGLIAHFITQKYRQQTLAYMIAKSTAKDSTILEKSIASLAKLALAMKKNKSYRRLSEITQQKFDNIMNLNLELLAKNQAVVSFPPQSIERALQCTWYAYKVDIQLSYDFYSQTIPIKIQQSKTQQPEQYICKYLRYMPTKKNKIFKITSTAYSSKITILPTKDIKYKIFILDSEEYDDILRKSSRQEDRLDLGVYLRVFFANLLEHEVADYEHVWMPETVVKFGKFQITNLDQFDKAQSKTNKIEDQSNNIKQSHKRGILKSQLNLTYTDYLGNSLKIQPNHRDLVITPPFIIGILNMQIQTSLEGSPIYVKRIDKTDMWWIKQVPKVVKESD